jgi:hypothetical protein
MFGTNNITLKRKGPAACSPKFQYHKSPTEFFFSVFVGHVTKWNFFFTKGWGILEKLKAHSSGYFVFFMFSCQTRRVSVGYHMEKEKRKKKKKWGVPQM